MAMLTVNGVEMPAPGAMKVSIFDVSSVANRNAQGEAVIDHVAAKRRLELRWPCLAPDQLQILLNATCGAFFEAGYPDPIAGGMRTMTCYCGERAMGVLRMDGGRPLWTDIEMNWIER